MHKNNAGNKGFSLVELIIVVAIFGVVFVVVSNTFLNVMKAGIKAEALKEVRQQGDFILNRLRNDLRTAVEIPTNSSDSKLCHKSLGSSYDQIVFRTKDNVIYRYTIGGVNQLRMKRITLADAVVLYGLSPDWREWNQTNWDSIPANPYETTITDGNNAIVSTMEFDCTSLSTRKQVDITFMLVHQNLIPSVRSEDRAEANFETTVIVRNLGL